MTLFASNDLKNRCILLAIAYDGLEEFYQIKTNQFFQNFYLYQAQNIQNFEGREHTGQVKAELRQQRETNFRNGKLASLFCSHSFFFESLNNVIDGVTLS